MPASPAAGVGGHPSRRREVGSMIPATFDYERADSADDAICPHRRGTATRPSSWPAATRLLPLMKLRLAQPSVLVDVGRLTDLSYIRDAGDHIAIGALTRHHDVETSDLAEGAGAAPGPRRLARSATRRCATAAPSAARSPTPTRPPTCPATVLALGGVHGGPVGPGGERVIAARRLLHRLPRVGAGARRAAHRDPRARRCPAPAGRSRSSTAGPRTGPSSAWPRCAQRHRRRRRW